MMKTVGVLNLQGAVAEHQRMLEALGVNVVLVKEAADLNSLDGLIIPGGESTAIGRLIRDYQLESPLIEFAKAGHPILGTCAGLILCSTTEKEHPSEVRLNLIDLTVVRNGFGRQVNSFETSLSVASIGDHIPAIFIRAPYIKEVATGVRVLATIDDKIVAAECNTILVTSFHPELSEDTRVLSYFLSK
ncbi:pyridoxal 5'-phosphate synthase glutaminase subunit PdxT [Carnobacterium divergens]|uniref:Pyridoxal 5'-phosphate synthase subunit PdxT n=1 Tax=Carnobacterium divergens DSM 20623 TaxID=1449336 RepID=A0A0R2I7D4_CARDV|nr:pyridoxal 5'-phosphate synthase glutaminase subunit PdxT [Carnobacterium divergens]KRN57911.1 glutamine amidotransferase subunit PdxT [Carnobacterium divergens DSM 20623]MDO0874541.1 pyridoxal 5'-phosphate synthase glutaminase subunit PdxT [Carnobacterium divergens]SUX22322.1 Glutamine amidotransferase subunit pdxT [Carnobacterium divergens]